MKKVILIFLMGMLPLAAFADLPFQPTFTWTLPTAYTDGSVLDPAFELDAVNLYCTGAAAVQQTFPVSTSFTSPVGMFSAGIYACHLTVVANLANGGAESSPSNTVNFTVSQKAPSPMIDFGVI